MSQEHDGDKKAGEGVLEELSEATAPAMKIPEEFSRHGKAFAEEYASPIEQTGELDAFPRELFYDQIGRTEELDAVDLTELEPPHAASPLVDAPPGAQDAGIWAPDLDPLQDFGQTIASIPSLDIDYATLGIDPDDDAPSLFDDAAEDIENALARIDFSGDGSLDGEDALDEVELDDDEIIELDDLDGFELVEEDSELSEQTDPSIEPVPDIDPFQATGMVMFAADDDVIELDDLDAEEIIELDPLAEEGFGGAHELGDDTDDELVTPEHDPPSSPPAELPRRPVDPIAAVKLAVAHAPRAEVSEARSRLRVGLDAVGGKIELREPWAQWSAQMRLEILEEPDKKKRAAFLYLFSTMLRLHGHAGVSSARQLEETSAQVLGLLRAPLIHKLVECWSGPLPEFIEQLDKLREFDEQSGIDGREARVSSIATARMLGELLRGQSHNKLEELMREAQTVSAMTARALFAHRRGDRLEASGHWRQISRFLQGDEREALLTLSGYLAQDRAAFFEKMTGEDEAEMNSRILVNSMQYEACWQGEHIMEARAIERLLDFEQGDEHAEMGALLGRLASLRRSFGKGGELGSEAMALDAAQAAAHAAPNSLVHWVLLERYARANADLDALIEALEHQVRLTDDPAARALVREQYASALAARDGWSDASIHALEHCVQESNDCLPAILMLGQERVSNRDWSSIIRLRSAPSIGESQNLNPAWRRADLLERTGGDVREVLSLYRSARHEHPSSIHLFNCVEIALAKLGQWRGLANLYDTTAREHEHLAVTLEQNGVMLQLDKLAVEMYLEDVYTPQLESLEQYASAGRVYEDLPGQDAIKIRDEFISWRLMAEMLKHQQVNEARALIDRVIAGLDDDAPREEQLRARLWFVYIAGWQQRRHRDCTGALQEIFELSESLALRRFAFHGLLRLGADEWLAEQLLTSKPARAFINGVLRTPDVRARAMPQLLAAELLARAQHGERAVELLMQVADEEESAREEHLQRAMTLALRTRSWSAVSGLLAQPLIARHHHPALRLVLNTCVEETRDVDALELSPDAYDLAIGDAVQALSLIEASLRTRSWEQLARVLTDTIRAHSASRGAWLTFLRVLLVWACEQGLFEHARALDVVRDWSDTGGEGAGELEMLMLLASWYRCARVLGREADADSVGATLRELFGDATVALLEREVPLHKRPRDEVQRWYQEQAGKADGTTRAYLRAMASIYGWLFGERDRECATRLADAASGVDDALHVIRFFCALAHRDVGQHASAERYLSGMGSQREIEALSAWAGARAVLHLATTQGGPEDAHRQLQDNPRLIDRAPWLIEFTQLLARALRKHEARAVLREAEYGEPGRAAAARLELAELVSDHREVVILAEAYHAGACLLAEVRAATERRDWKPEHNLEVRYATLRKSLAHDPQDVVRQNFLDFLVDVESCVIASPWGPLRLIDDDLARLGLMDVDLVRLLDFAEHCSQQGVGSHARLIIARQLSRAGRYRKALELMPDELDVDLASRAWLWLSYQLDPACAAPKSAAARLAFWRERASAASAPMMRAEISYEVARILERSGDDDAAFAIYKDIVEAHPEFVLAEISLARVLLARRNWSGLAGLWSRALERAPSENEAVGLAYRLGFLYERRMTDHSNALAQALDYYARVVAVRPTYWPALHAMLRVAYVLGKYDVAADCLQSLIPVCTDRASRAAYFIELAMLYEQELGAPRRALQAYISAHELEPANSMALFGVLRTDTSPEREHAVRVLAERLDFASSSEAQRLSDHLFLLCESSPQAEYLMRQRFGDHLVWRLVQLAEGIERGELHEEALFVLSSAISDPQLDEIFWLLERALTSGLRPGRRDALEERLERAEARAPAAEGMLVSETARAWRDRNYRALAQLAMLGSRRARGQLEAATEHTRSALMLRWTGAASEALASCERLLERTPEFLPAVKLAHLIARELPDWPSVARWAAVEAEISHVPSIALASRVEASQVQTRHLGDLDAAIRQLSIVLKQNPGHPDAFDDLKGLLIQANRPAEALKLCEGRLHVTRDTAKRVAMLNEMADTAMNHLQNQELAVKYLAASIREQPRQLRRLRILAELYEAIGQYPQALSVYDAATKLSKDARLSGRMVLQMAHILERQLHQYDRAGNAYRRVLDVDPENMRALHGMVRVRQRHGDFIGALEGLDILAKLAKSVEDLRKIRVMRLEFTERGRLPMEALIEAARDVLYHHPDHAEAIDILREQLQAAGRESEVDQVLRQIMIDSLTEHTSPPIGAFFSLARKSQLDDLAYCLAGCGRWLGVAGRDMLTFHENARHANHWPTKPMSPDLTAGVLPSQMSVAFFEIVRRTSEGLVASCDPIPYSQFAKRRNRLTQPSSQAQELAWRWPGLFNLELRDVYVTEKLPMGSAIIWDDGVRLILDKRWEGKKDTYKLLVRLGTQIAAWSMGIGYWSALGREAQVALFSEIIAAVSPSWTTGPVPKLPGWFSHEKFKRWVAKTGADNVTAYAFELASRMGPRALGQQFLMLELAMERLSCVVLPDPGQFLQYTVRFGVEHGPSHRPWTFLLNPAFARLRYHLGVSLER